MCEYLILTLNPGFPSFPSSPSIPGAPCTDKKPSTNTHMHKQVKTNDKTHLVRYLQGRESTGCTYLLNTSPGHWLFSEEYSACHVSFPYASVLEIILAPYLQSWASRRSRRACRSLWTLKSWTSLGKQK